MKRLLSLVARHQARPKIALNRVFLGKAEKVKTALPDNARSGATIQTTTFYVLDSWKGEKANRIVTKINVQCCLCGANFYEGETYLVFAFEAVDGFYSTSICSMTMGETWALATITILNELIATDHQD